MSETTLLYTLSTLAQTCAALAAFVGAVGVFRLQLLRDQRKDVERGLRVTAALLGTIGHATTQVPMVVILKAIEKGREKRGEDAPFVRAALRERARWDAFVPRMQGSRWALIIFEVWNVAVIAAALVGFNYVPSWAGAPWAFYALWIVAVLTAGITVGCVIVWTQGVEE